jgi:pyruvyl transferase EpsI
MKKSIKKILPIRIYTALKYNPLRKLKYMKKWDAKQGDYFRQVVKSGCRIFLLNTPEHKNLGDLAIAEAETSYFKLVMPEVPVVEVSSLSENVFGLDILKKIIPKDALLLVHGGGYIGTDWPNENEVFLRTISLFSDNCIILLPQSVFYSSGREGRLALNQSKNIYARHKDLHLFMRDKISYDLAKQYHPEANIYLVPDIVLSVKYETGETERGGVLLCMRTDKEKLLDGSDIACIEKICGKYGQLEYTDTVIEHDGKIYAEARGAFLNAKLKQFARAKLVITDRLHGMVFAALTGTPCIALSNHNHKVKGLYDWIKDLNYIKYIDDIKELEESVESVMFHGPDTFHRELYLPHFAELEKLLSERC